MRDTLPGMSSPTPASALPVTPGLDWDSTDSEADGNPSSSSCCSSCVHPRATQHRGTSRSRAWSTGP